MTRLIGHYMANGRVDARAYRRHRFAARYTMDDVELLDPFAGGKPSERRVKPLKPVPGASKPARNLYDVCQALSWIATQRNSADERLEWQGHIPGFIENLRRHSN